MRKGRFSQPAAERALRYGESVSFDWRLYRHDIAGSIAHDAALAAAAIVTADEQQKINRYGARRAGSVLGNVAEN
jgi:argininosuccinate lyase